MLLQRDDAVGPVDVADPDTRKLPDVRLAESRPALCVLVEGRRASLLRRVLKAAVRQSRTVANACRQVIGINRMKTRLLNIR